MSDGKTLPAPKERVYHKPPSGRLPQLVEENHRKVRLILEPKIMEASVCAALGRLMYIPVIEQFYNEAGVLKAERASLL